MLHSWCDDVITVMRPTTQTVRGSLVRSWEHATEHTISGCSVQPTDSTTDFAKRAKQETFTMHLFAPPHADIQRFDRVRVNMGDGSEMLFEIDGAPYQRKSPTGRVSSTQADLVAWSG